MKNLEMPLATELLARAVTVEFGASFGYEPMLVVRAPGRINLIGEHTDYNEGLVLPAAIDREVCFAVAPNELGFIRLVACDKEERVEISIAEALQPGPVQWANYLLGVVAQLRRRGLVIKGFDCAFGGNIPMGSGLSSSAAVECGLACALNQLYGLGIGALELAQLAQAAEHEFAGVQCGLMDQFASVMGRAGQVVELDCRSLEYQYYPFDVHAAHIVLCNSGVKHNLAESAYNERRAQCEQGVAVLRASHPAVRSLRDATVAMLHAHRAELGELLFRRCRYVVEENQRVRDFTTSLTTVWSPADLGKLLYASHAGLRDDYEVSCPELDALVEAATGLPGVFGARMMGGGFGGCTLNLVAPDHVAAFQATVGERFAARFGYVPATYAMTIVAGVSALPVPAATTL